MIEGYIYSQEQHPIIVIPEFETDEEEEKFYLREAFIASSQIVKLPEFRPGTSGNTFYLTETNRLLKAEKFVDVNFQDQLEVTFLGNELVVDPQIKKHAIAIGGQLVRDDVIKDFSEKISKISEADPVKKLVFLYGNIIENELGIREINGINYKKLSNYEAFRNDFSLKDLYLYFFAENHNGSTRVGMDAFMLSFLNTEDLSSNLWREGKTTQAATKKVLKLSRSLARMRSDISDAIFCPESPEHEGLKDVISSSLESRDGYDRYEIVSYLSDKTSMSKLYKRAYQAFRNGGDGNFYQLLMRSVKNALEAGEDPENLLFMEDIEAIYNPSQKVESENEKEERTHQEIIQSIISNISQKEFEISPDGIDFGALSKPTSVSLQLSRDNANEYSFNFGYENKFGEEMEVKVNIYQDQNLDWNVLEMPQENAEISQELVKLGKKLLLHALATAQETHDQKSKPVEVYHPERKKQRFQRQIHKGYRPHHQQVPRNIDAHYKLPDVETTVRQGIILPEPDELDKMLEQFSRVDRDYILKAIQNVNQSGKGRFLKLEIPKKQNEQLFRFRVGNARILLKAAESSKGKMNFSIVDVAPRNKVYENVF